MNKDDGFMEHHMTVKLTLCINRFELNTAEFIHPPPPKKNKKAERASPVYKKNKFFTICYPPHRIF